MPSYELILCRPSAEYLFIASAPRCQTFMTLYSSRYLLQQLGAYKFNWKYGSAFLTWKHDRTRLTANLCAQGLIKLFILETQKSLIEVVMKQLLCEHVFFSPSFSVISGEVSRHTVKATASLPASPGGQRFTSFFLSFQQSLFPLKAFSCFKIKNCILFCRYFVPIYPLGMSAF